MQSRHSLLLPTLPSKRELYVVLFKSKDGDGLPFVVGTAPSVSELVSSGNCFPVEEFQPETKQRALIIHCMFVES